MMGTPFYSWYLRLMGAKIGKHCFIQTTFISEWELVEIGDYVALNFMSVVQNHLFEDRIMKASHLKIWRRVHGWQHGGSVVRHR